MAVPTSVDGGSHRAHIQSVMRARTMLVVADGEVGTSVGITPPLQNRARNANQPTSSQRWRCDRCVSVELSGPQAPQRRTGLRSSSEVARAEAHVVVRAPLDEPGRNDARPELVYRGGDSHNHVHADSVTDDAVASRS